MSRPLPEQNLKELIECPSFYTDPSE